MREKEIEAYFCKRVKEAGGLQRKFVSPGHRGVPDRIVVLKGHVYFIELKAPEKGLRPDQVREHAKITEVGGEAYVVNTKGGVDFLVHYMETRS